MLFGPVNVICDFLVWTCFLALRHCYLLLVFLVLDYPFLFSSSENSSLFLDIGFLHCELAVLLCSGLDIKKRTQTVTGLFCLWILLLTSWFGCPPPTEENHQMIPTHLKEIVLSWLPHTELSLFQILVERPLVNRRYPYNFLFQGFSSWANHLTSNLFFWRSLN